MRSPVQVVGAVLRADRAEQITSAEYVSVVEGVLFCQAVSIRVGLGMSLTEWPYRYDKLRDSFTGKRVLAGLRT